MCLNRVGEGRACWSLGNAYVSLANHKQALHYARKHLDISKEVRYFYKILKDKWTFGEAWESCIRLNFIFLVLFICPQIGDRNGELTARMNVEQLMEALGVSESDLSPSSSEFEMQGDSKTFFPSTRPWISLVNSRTESLEMCCTITFYNWISQNGVSDLKELLFPVSLSYTLHWIA